jgi:hypothetical protein
MHGSNFEWQGARTSAVQHAWTWPSGDGMNEGSPTETNAA